MEINVDLLKILEVITNLIKVADKHRVGMVLTIVFMIVYFTLKK